MNNYNLSNLDIAAKKALETVLRPNFYIIIEPWVAQATSKQKNQIVYVQKIGSMVFDDIKATGLNAFGKAALTNEVKRSFDMAQTGLFLRRTNSEVVNAPQRGARDHFRNYESIQTHNACQRYFTSTRDGLAAQPFARLLEPRILRQLDQWEVFGSKAPPQLKAEVAQVLRSLEKQAIVMPTYPQIVRQSTQTLRGPILHEYSERYKTVAHQRQDAIRGKLEELQRTASEPTLHEREYMGLQAGIQEVGGQTIFLQDLPPIQYSKAKKKSTMCSINFAGGSQDMATTYMRHYIGAQHPRQGLQRKMQQTM